jgi:hypothetical protein
MKLIFPPIIDELNKLFLKTEKEFTIICPWLQDDVLLSLLNEAKNNKKATDKIDFRVLTVSENIFNGSTDLSVIKRLLKRGATIHFTQKNLHAKIYIADSKFAIISSANFTRPGMTANYEIGAWVEGDEINKLIKNTDEVFHETSTHLIDISWLEENTNLIKENIKKCKKIKDAESNEIKIPNRLLGKKIKIGPGKSKNTYPAAEKQKNTEQTKITKTEELFWQKLDKDGEFVFKEIIDFNEQYKENFKMIWRTKGFSFNAKIEGLKKPLNLFEGYANNAKHNQSIRIDMNELKRRLKYYQKVISEYENKIRSLPFKKGDGLAYQWSIDGSNKNEINDYLKVVAEMAEFIEKKLST